MTNSTIPLPSIFPPDFTQRFWASANVGGDNECWPWRSAKPGAYNSAGYGRVAVLGRQYGAHRIALALAGRAPTTSEIVRHRCDNTACVNPDHLMAGSQAENMQDMKDRGRSNRGERNGRAKLTQHLADEIRACGLSSRAAARKFGVSPSCIMDVRHNRKWAA